SSWLHSSSSKRSATTGPSSPDTYPSSLLRNEPDHIGRRRGDEPPRAIPTRSRPPHRESNCQMETTMNTQQDLIADPSNAGQVGAWDGNEGAFWAAQARRFDETLANCHGPFLTAAAIREDNRVLDVGCG